MTHILVRLELRQISHAARVENIHAAQRSIEDGDATFTNLVVKIGVTFTASTTTCCFVGVNALYTAANKIHCRMIPLKISIVCCHEKCSNNNSINGAKMNVPIPEPHTAMPVAKAHEGLL
uniref:Uncharacterized protein n=1 Tax=Romanomermis culicivorax TaxID=13658 RepID=A0A915HWU6_ROMCU